MFSALATQKSNAITWYLNRYNELSSKLVTKSLELKRILTRSNTDIPTKIKPQKNQGAFTSDKKPATHRWASHDLY